MKAQNDHVYYVEPNYVFESKEEESSQFKQYDVAPPLEDYCIAVDLQVEVIQRNNGMSSSDSKIYIVSFTSTDEKTYVKFNEGKRVKMQKKDGSESFVSFLSTDACDYATYSDILSGTTTECFGINSIDIEYNTYRVPIVTINFTDIRGVSLFSEEEDSHSEPYVDADGNKHYNTSGSFFKTFFTLPRPRYQLMVKGFYGAPITYQLMCSDFRANFNAETGNFGATVKFVGYSYSVLNDITLNTILSAPYNEYAGKEYWENNKASRFMLDNTCPMPTMVELCRKINEYLKNTEQEGQESIEYKEVQSITNKLTSINSLIDTSNLFFKNLKDSITESCVNDNVLIGDREKCILYLSNSKDDLNIKKDTYTYYKSLTDKMREPHFQGVRLQDFSNKMSVIDDDAKKKILKTSMGNNFNNLLKNNDDLKYYYYYNLTDFYSDISDKSEKLNKELVEVNNRLLGSSEDGIVKYIGFKPTIKNITFILLAHFETLVHSLYACVNKVNSDKRTKESIGLDTTDLNLENTKNLVGSFPRVDIVTPVLTTTEKVEGWIGELKNGQSQPEAMLVEGLIKGLQTLTTITSETRKNIENHNKVNKEIIKNINIPLCASDFYAKSHIFSDVDFNDISDIVGRLVVRFVELSISNTHINDYLSVLGKMDAINFFELHKNKLSKEFIELVKNNVFTSDLIYDIASNKNKTYAQEKGYVWQLDGDCPLIKKDGYGSFTPSRLYYEKSIIIPTEGYKWSDLFNFVSYAFDNKEKFVSNLSVVDNDGKTLDYPLIIETRYDEFKNTINGIKNDEYDAKKFLCSNTNEERYYSTLGKEINFLYKTFAASENEIQREVKEGESCTFTFPEDGYPNLESANEVSNFKNLQNYYNYNNFICIVNDNGRDIIYKRSYKRLTNKSEIDSYTISRFCGFKEGVSHNYYCVFTQSEYLKLNECEDSLKADSLKASMFLLSFLSDGVEFANVCEYITEYKSTAKPFKTVPYMYTLLIGAYIFLYKNEYGVSVFGMHGNALKKRLRYVKKSFINSFEREFKNWLSSDYYRNFIGFKKIKENFELKITEEKLKKFTQIAYYHNDDVENQYIDNSQITLGTRNIKNVDSLICYLFDDNFFKNYMGFAVRKINGDLSLILHNRDTSVYVGEITKLCLSPCYIVLPTPPLSYNRYSYLNYSLKTYLSSFVTKLKSMIEENKITGDYQSEYNIEKINADVNLKRAIYKYLKLSYDNWFSGSKESDWIKEEFFDKHWYFIDSYYNKIDDKLMINVFHLIDAIYSSISLQSYSFLSFLSMLYQKNMVNFVSLQNFMNMVNEKTGAENMETLFKPVPYNQIDYNSVDIHPSFIAMYTHDYSKRLDDKNGEYLSDSYDISGMDYQLPEPIRSKTEKNGYKIPCFGVSYGRQYQSFFKDISINTDKPIVTEESIKTYMQIASAFEYNNEKTSTENEKKKISIGQDLFQVYASHSYTCNVTMMGCAWIQPLMYFQLLNVPMFKGAYLIERVTHHIEPGNMETKFMGVRMSKISNPMITNPFISKNYVTTSSPSDIQDFIDNRSRLADFDNDCEYKFFSPLGSNDGVGMDETELNLTLEDYEKIHNGSWSKLVREKYNGKLGSTTILQLLSDCVYSEAGNQDTLGRQAVLNVVFNRYMHHGKNLMKVFVGSNHSLETPCADKTCEELVKNIFTLTPSILVGKRTYVKDSVPICFEGKKTGEYTHPSVITERNVRVVDGYCTVKGYNVDDDSNVKKEPKYGWWTKAKYQYQHDNKSVDGHVFVGGAYNKEKEYWNGSNDSANNKDKSQDLGVDLFNSIKKTIDFSKELGIQDLEYKSFNKEDKTFSIKANPLNLNYKVFDVVLNTYYSFFSKLFWVVKNEDGQSLPSEIVITPCVDSNNRNISIVSYSENGDLKVLNQYNGLNEKFYTSLHKKYGTINKDQKAIVNALKNFTEMIESNKNDWDKKMNELLSKSEISACGMNVNLPIFDGFSWDGTGVGADANAPIGVNNFNYNPSGASDYAAKNSLMSSIGKCAKYVRNAMMNGGNLKPKNYPLSACVYSKFLPAWGFVVVCTGSNGKFDEQYNNYKPIDGDIAVISGIKNGGENTIYGHIHIYHEQTKKWYSDFPCNSLWCYSSVKRPFIVYRYEKNNIA